MFSEAEKNSRHRAIGHFLSAQNLKALILIGEPSPGWGFCGHFRYYTNNRVIFSRQVVVVFADSESVLFAESEFQRQTALKRSFVSDCRLSNNFVADVADLLKERGVFAGRVGVNFEILPSAWHTYLKQKLPQVELVETHEHILKIRFERSREEMDIFRKGAALGDGGFEAALRVIRPGVSEYEIVAAIENYARARGGEEHFTLIGSGRFALGDNNGTLIMSSPSHRRIELGDSITMEITPRYEGYWTQLVRTVNVGKNNTDLLKIHRVCRDAIIKGLEQFKPGKMVKDVVSAMESYVASCGYVLKPPIGHICGVDLIEARVSSENETLLKPGTAVIIHPTVFTPDGKTSFFWGETYLVTEDGYERLHRTGDELFMYKTI
jgi:Xaa-Pro aminopeptidase